MARTTTLTKGGLHRDSQARPPMVAMELLRRLAPTLWAEKDTEQIGENAGKKCENEKTKKVNQCKFLGKHKPLQIERTLQKKLPKEHQKKGGKLKFKMWRKTGRKNAQKEIQNFGSLLMIAFFHQKGDC